MSVKTQENSIYIKNHAGMLEKVGDPKGKKLQ
jgi:hypothetical protein